jgi:hypothetical protein
MKNTRKPRKLIRMIIEKEANITNEWESRNKYYLRRPERFHPFWMETGLLHPARHRQEWPHLGVLP